jgi:HEAT repeat protein
LKAFLQNRMFLLDVLGDKDEDIRKDALDALKSGKPLSIEVPYLTKCLTSHWLPAQLYAADAMTHIGPEAQGGVSALVRAIDQQELRKPALMALRAIGRTEESAQALKTTLQDLGMENDARTSAASGLAEFGSKDDFAALVESLLKDNKHSGVRQHIAVCLARGLAEGWARVTEQKDKDKLVADLITALKREMESLQFEVCYPIVEAFGAIGSDAKDAIPAIFNVLASDLHFP